jgi:hypothetical protein
MSLSVMHSCFCGYSNCIWHCILFAFSFCLNTIIAFANMYLSSQVFSNTSRAPAWRYIQHQQCYDCDWISCQLVGADLLLDSELRRDCCDKGGHAVRGHMWINGSNSCSICVGAAWCGICNCVMSNSPEPFMDTCVLLCLHRCKKLVSHDVSCIICLYLSVVLILWIFELCVIQRGLNTEFDAYYVLAWFAWCRVCICLYVMQWEYYVIIMIENKMNGRMRFRSSQQYAFIYYILCWTYVCCNPFCCELCIVFVCSLQRPMWFVEDFQMQINFSFIWRKHPQWWRDMLIIIVCSSRKLIMFWQYSLDDMIISINDADGDHSVWLQLQAIWGGKHCWLYMFGELHKINDTIHCINAVWNTSRSWTYTDVSAYVPIQLATYLLTSLPTT